MELNQNQKQSLSRFRNFVSFRNKISLLLSLAVLICYYAFIFSVGAFPDILGYRLGSSSVTLGIVCGIFIIALCIIVTGFYTFIANQYLDKNQEELLKDLENNNLTKHLQNGELSYTQKETQ
ncbi:DUF485 domain-containing protein [Campylobacter sp. US33a]|uniref:DUF485 domain-containing protein n=1 Tax=Campylobacter sp. CCS1377 TaxID=3158229 RepID=A0AAU7E719_9BACT|nr:DUF485 domain-containing protein [Campylobacter sp. US33a]MCW1360809.1 DUF485 domain-containing protein [Campylobacter jejuni]TEY01973.1 DUF485 domain-containing protein [Campylobacter sp. US33a]